VSVRVAADGGMAVVTLDRPGKLNAMTDAMWASLESLLGRLAADPAVRVIVLTGAGGNFCAGSDVGGLLAADVPLADRIAVSNRCVLAVHASAKPVVAVVDGVAAGAGLNLALACDLVVASDRARLIQAFIRRGLAVDSGGSWLLPRLAGDHRARELVLLGGTLAAADACAWGLVNRVVPFSELAAAGREIAERLAAASPEALAASRRLLRDSWGTSLDGALAAELAAQLEVIDSPAAREAIAGFTSGRQ
jgi:enoyl-CoA hydratase/carnithine racemase